MLDNDYDLGGFSYNAPDSYDAGAMSRAVQTSEGRIYGGQDSSSPWLDFSTNLFGKSGGLLEAAGKFAENSAYANRYTSMASGLDLKASAFGMAANWANIGLAFPELQQQIINIQTNIQRKQSLEQWQNRIASTKARYAKSGIAVDAGRDDTPLKAMLTLLEASDEELRWIATDKSVREFNEVTMPGIQTRLQEAGATYQKDLLKTQQTQALRMASIATTHARVTGIAGVVGAGAKAYGG